MPWAYPFNPLHPHLYLVPGKLQYLLAHVVGALKVDFVRHKGTVLSAECLPKDLKTLLGILSLSLTPLLVPSPCTLP